ncbi:MAG: flavodoxin family protein [Euryarchaeota archaeon]|nr:flavodoxin family protein [Euryarchaeota archaeon]
MEVLGIVSSPRKKGSTETLVQAILDGASSAGHSTVRIDLNDLELKGCQACMRCRTHEACSHKDDLTSVFDRMKKADAVVFSSPIYMGQRSGHFRPMEGRMFQFTDMHFQPRITPAKKAVIVTSHGDPEPKAFEGMSSELARTLKLFGFDVVERLNTSGGNDPRAVNERQDLLDKGR